jgi:hypothetical protein
MWIANGFSAIAPEGAEEKNPGTPIVLGNELRQRKQIAVS